MTASCSIGDETVKVWSSESSAESYSSTAESRQSSPTGKVWSSESSAESHSGNAESRQSSPTGNGIPYSEIVEKARLYILTLGGFEAFACWGLIRPDNEKAFAEGCE